jgi:hypothetical protein
MAIRILANTVGAEMMYIAATDGSFALTSDQTYLANLSWGPQHLMWSASDTGARRITYINKAGTLEADHVVIAGADSAVGQNVQFRAYSIYDSTATTIENFTSWNPTLYGPKQRDYAEGLGLYSNQQAFEVYFSSTFEKTFPKIYFSKAVVFNEGGSCIRSPFWENIQIGKQMFGVSERIQLTLTYVDDATLSAFNALPKLYEQPFFVYDTTSEFIYDTLVHVVLKTAPTVKAFDEFHQMSLDLYVLRYPG